MGKMVSSGKIIVLSLLWAILISNSTVIPAEATEDNYEELETPISPNNAEAEPFPSVLECDSEVSNCETPVAKAITKRTEFTTEDILPPNFDLSDSSCLDYCFEGVCFFVYCTVVTGCQIETSIRFSHKNPDFVVSAYREPGMNPWKEIQEVYGWAQVEVLNSQVRSLPPWGIGIDEAGQGDQTSNASHTRPLVYRELDIFGYPTKLYNLSSSAFCDTKAEAFMPVFQSGFDGILWRFAVQEYLFLAASIAEGIVTLEMPDISMLSPIGTPFINNWGWIFKRSGFTAQYDYAKANAVVASKAANIISQDDQPHIYQPMAGEPNNGHQLFHRVPSAHKPGNGDVWQMIVPLKDNQCHVFGDDSFANKWSDHGKPLNIRGRQSEDRASAFVLWRPYECCEIKGEYIGSILSRVCIDDTEL